MSCIYAICKINQISSFLCALSYREDLKLPLSVKNPTKVNRNYKKNIPGFALTSTNRRHYNPQRVTAKMGKLGCQCLRFHVLLCKSCSTEITTYRTAACPPAFGHTILAGTRSNKENEQTTNEG